LSIVIFYFLIKKYAKFQTVKYKELYRSTGLNKFTGNVDMQISGYRPGNIPSSL